MTLRELFGVIAPDKLTRASELPLADALHDAEGTEAPLLVRLFMVIGTWIGAAMAALVFVAMEIYEFVPGAVVLGVALFAGAIVLSRRTAARGRSLAMTQVIWVMALGAHALWAGVCIELEVDETAMLLAWMVLNIAAIFVIRVPSFALASAVCAVGFATALCAAMELPMYPLWVALPVTAIATAVWIYEVPWAARLGRTWTALAYGLPLGVAGPLTLLNLERESLVAAKGPEAMIATVVIAGLIGLVGLRAKQEYEQGGAIEARVVVLGLLGLFVVIMARHVPGLSLGLLWLVIAQLRKSVGLQALGAIQLGGFLFTFYYQLETSLLLKSLWVISTGAVLLVGAYLFRGQGRSRDPAIAEARVERTSRWLPAIALVLITSGIVVGASVHKERVLATGEVVLLPLAPVDPRSLMQGDYMELRYALEEEMELDSRPDLARHGRLVIAVGDDRVGHFVRIDDGRELGEGELVVEYRLRDGWGDRVRIGGESFLFAEGSGELYAGARFGEVVVSGSGEVVLVGLRGPQLERLGVGLHGGE